MVIPEWILTTITGVSTLIFYLTLACIILCGFYILYCMVKKKGHKLKILFIILMCLNIVLLFAAMGIISDTSSKLAFGSLIVTLIIFTLSFYREENSEQNTKDIINRLIRIEGCLEDRLPAPEPTQPPDDDDPADLPSGN